MSLQITGKNIHVGESFRSYADEKLDGAIDKYLGSYLTAHVRVEKERGRFHTSCTVRLRTGLVLESSGEGTDAYASADAAFEHLEKRMRRYKRRLKNRHHSANDGRQLPPAIQAGDFVVSPADEAETVDAGSSQEHPLVVAETERTLHELSVSEAVMRLDLTEDAFLVFRNGSNGEINVVYRRTDGNIGWIDPATPSVKSRRPADKSGARMAAGSRLLGGKQSQGKRSRTSS